MSLSTKETATVGFGALLFAACTAFVIMVLAALLGGLVIYALWPSVVPFFFPGLVASGAIAGQVAYGPCVIGWLLVNMMLPRSSKSK